MAREGAKEMRNQSEKSFDGVENLAFRSGETELNFPRSLARKLYGSVTHREAFTSEAKHKLHNIKNRTKHSYNNKILKGKPFAVGWKSENSFHLAFHSPSPAWKELWCSECTSCTQKNKDTTSRRLYAHTHRYNSSFWDSFSCHFPSKSAETESHPKEEEEASPVTPWNNSWKLSNFRNWLGKPLRR